jgi:multisubunit Na+/H+ antiporter MnhG subunit
MDKLAIHLALHGAVVLTISIAAGLCLYSAILKNKNEAAWHLVHAGGTVRGVMLMALAAIIHIPVLPLWQLSTLVWLIIFFVWTSMLAMIIAAASGDRGLGFSGSNTNKLVYILYALGTIAIFPACLLLIVGLFKAL